MKKLRPDDPRITDYALGELPSKEVLEVAEQIAERPELQEDLAKTQALGRLLCESFEREGLALHPVQREIIKRIGISQDELAVRAVKQRNQWIHGAAITLAAVACLSLVLFIMARTPVEDDEVVEAQNGPEQLQMSIVLSPAAITTWGQGENELASVSSTSVTGQKPYEMKAAESSHEAREQVVAQILEDPQQFFVSAEATARALHLPEAESFIPLQENDYLASTEANRTTVPVMAGRTSFAWVERFLREQNQLPPRDAVRLEELVNYPDYSEDAGAQVGGVALTSELVPCPWNEESLLLGLLLQRAPGSAENEKVSVQLEVDQGRVAEYRLLGFAQPDGDVVSGANASHPLAAGNSTYVFYELRPGDVPFDETALGHVELKVSGLDSELTIARHLDIPSIPGRWLDSSNSFQTAATVAAYALVLRESPHKGSLSMPWVESLARQTLQRISSPSEDIKKVLELIIETRHLAGLQETV